MGSLQNIRYGLDGRLATIPDLNHSHTIPRGAVLTPFAFISVPMMPNDPVVMYDESFGAGTARWNLKIILLLGQVDSDVAQDLLDPYISDDVGNPQSVFQAVMGDIHLTYNSVPTATSVRVKNAHSYCVHKIAGIEYIGVDFDTEVISSP